MTVPEALVAVPAAVGAAAVFGITGALQHRAAHRVERPGSQVGLMLGLVRQRLWVVSVLGSLLGIGLQALALDTGPIILVQPLLVSGVLFAAVTGFALDDRPVDWPFLGSALLCVGGLSGFLIAASPQPGHGRLTLGTLIPLAAGFGGLLVLLAMLGYRARGPWRQISLALAAGLDYGLNAGVLKTMLAVLAGGVGAVLTHWSLYALVLLGPLGFVLNQDAFREGPLAAPALAVITVTDPLVAIGIGLLWFGEQVRTDVWAIAAEVVALGVMAAGVLLVAYRAPHLVERPEEPSPGAAVAQRGWWSR